MVKYDKEGKIIVGKLDDTKVLSKEMIESYDYKTIKKYFDEIVEILEMNKLFHSVYKERLKYKVTDELEFKIYVNPNFQYFTIASGEKHVTESDTAIITMHKAIYEQYYELCELLLIKIQKAWNHLNEVEKFIIKSLEFDNPPATDEDLQDDLKFCNKRYYQYKKSGFIKMGTQLQLEEAKQNDKKRTKKVSDGE